ncbi:hypothetical protein C1I95_19935 [Micromonospora craterilacus]|uniref:MobA-like NTP transferase domain-containing protein n=1 Tax=Micromonospora craterilacus TaxID=1655439 RepID=A0A2W2DZ27_9ACTN|nr:hypothetical protein C1I95_19935 [Micromonospora craterilacus]
MILAAGAGRRYGGPKALPFLGSATEMLRAGGCDPVVVVLGAAAAAVIRQVGLDRPGSAVADGMRADELGRLPGDPRVVAVVNDEWATGMASSLRVGLRAAARLSARVVCVHLVDMPGVTPAAVRRLLDVVPPARPEGVLARATYAGEPGHPVLLGADHWVAVTRSAAGDRGARDYLRRHSALVQRVECGDVAQGFDVDTRRPADPGEPRGARSGNLFRA